ncbi:MAG: hypothetical protein ABIV63_01295, partial [Caldimonas sp.]
AEKQRPDRPSSGLYDRKQTGPFGGKSMRARIIHEAHALSARFEPGPERVASERPAGIRQHSSTAVVDIFVDNMAATGRMPLKRTRFARLLKT